MPISRELLTLAGREVGIYAALARLEEPTKERGGRAKRHFAVTPAGLETIRMTRQALTNLWSGVPVVEV